jgi:hypothetical protein
MLSASTNGDSVGAGLEKWAVLTFHSGYSIHLVDSQPCQVPIDTAGFDLSISSVILVCYQCHPLFDEGS